MPWNQPHTLPSYQQRILDNGVTLIGVPMPAPSVCAALYLSYGSVHEPASLCGISHLIEHLFFKGTERRSGEALTAATAAIGADTNALTWWLGICCHARMVSHHWEQGLRLIAEEMTRPRHTEESLEAERLIVREEKQLLASIPRHATIQALMAAAYPGHPLSRPIIGTDATLSAISLDDVTSYFRRILQPGRLTVVVAGSFAWDGVCAVAEEELGWLTPDAAGPPDPPVPPDQAGRLLVQRADQFSNTHLAYALRLGGHRDSDYFPAEILTTILGDETRTSSRLLRGVRQLGLVDDVVSSYTAFGGHGVLYTYAVTSPDRASDAHAAIIDQFTRLGDVTADEVARACRKLQSQIALDGETTNKRALSVARLFTGTGRLHTLDDISRQLGAVTPEHISSLIVRYRPAETCVGVALGPVDTLDGAQVAPGGSNDLASSPEC